MVGEGGNGNVDGTAPMLTDGEAVSVVLDVDPPALPPVIVWGCKCECKCACECECALKALALVGVDGRLPDPPPDPPAPDAVKVGGAAVVPTVGLVADTVDGEEEEAEVGPVERKKDGEESLIRRANGNMTAGTDTVKAGGTCGEWLLLEVVALVILPLTKAVETPSAGDGVLPRIGGSAAFAFPLAPPEVNSPPNADPLRCPGTCEKGWMSEGRVGIKTRYLKLESEIFQVKRLKQRNIMTGTSG